MKKLNHILFLFGFLIALQTTTAKSPVKLWFDESATYFEESLVLGNGKIKGIKGRGACLWQY